MSKTVDGIIKDWGERLDYGRTKGRAGKNPRGGPRRKPPPQSNAPSGPATREKVARTLRKAPEVVVKVTGGGKNMARIKAHMDYISRNGAVELEDENGQIYSGKEDVRDLRTAWKYSGIGIAEEGEKRREAFNIILSMPAGTDRKTVTDAARAFAANEFGGHQYAFAQHDDEKHSHVHLVVKAAGFDGSRLNPRKNDLQRWREDFAEQLRTRGIDANATPRRARGVVQKAERQQFIGMTRHRGKGGRDPATPYRHAQWLAEAEREAAGGERHLNPAGAKIAATRKQVHQTYGALARELAKGDATSQALALDVLNFVKAMPPLTTRHDERVAALRSGANGGAARVTPDPQQTREPQPQPQRPGPGSGRDR